MEATKAVEVRRGHPVMFAAIILLILGVCAGGAAAWMQQVASARQARGAAKMEALNAEMKARNDAMQLNNVGKEHDIIALEREGYGRPPTRSELQHDIADFTWEKTQFDLQMTDVQRGVDRDIAWCRQRLKTAK